MQAGFQLFQKPERPSALPGFEHVRRFWNPANERWSAKILPGQFFVTRNDEVITTILGSCISACVRDASLCVGGMNHFMLPEDTSAGKSSWLEGAGGLATRYGSYAMESLLNELMKLGADRSRLEIKLFGGGRILSSMTDVGAKNISFIREFLRVEGYAIAAQDLGESHPRHVEYYPATGRVMLKKLPPLSLRALADDERRYQASLECAPVSDDVELFD